MKQDCFYVFENKPVAIVKMLGVVGGRQMAQIRHIIRRSDAHGDIIDDDETEDVFCDCLQELTPKLANQLISKYNRTIAECNRRIHAFHECLGYM